MLLMHNLTWAIARALKDDNILTPRAYCYEVYGSANGHFDRNNPYDWNHTSVMMILKNRVYLGHMVNHKRTNKSFKIKESVNIPPEEQIVVLNTHEPLVDEDTFDVAQKVVSVKKRPTATGEQQIFTGLIKCLDCGYSLSFSKSGEKNIFGYLGCNLSRLKGNACCTPHRIRFEAMYDIFIIGL